MTHVVPIPALSDNYIWLIMDDEQQFVIIVDPGESQPVLNLVQQQSLQPVAILVTHRHWDHTSGIGEIVAQHPDIPVYGPAREKIPHRTHCMSEGDVIEFHAPGLSLTVMDIPGHTSGHIAYYNKDEGKLFCGDTLFSCGCGRVFDGTAEMLHHSLTRIARLPPDTILYCTHEYTLDNIGFAEWVEPHNKNLQARKKECFDLIDNDKPTLPTTVELELKTNPFLRTNLPVVIKKASSVAHKELFSPTEVFITLRNWKDTQYD
jgi:hydroxyacylglutathione hydrolase